MQMLNLMLRRVSQLPTNTLAIGVGSRWLRSIPTLSSANVSNDSQDGTSALKSPNAYLSNTGVTIFETMSQLANEHSAVNLGQGFPDVDGPIDMREHAAHATLNEMNQYPSMMGTPAMRQAIAHHYNEHYNLDVDWTETIVGAGATELLTASLMGLLEPGDEAVLIEPLYDCYLPIIKLVGAVAKTVRVTPPAWKLDFEALEQAFSSKTKLVLLNNPQNPTAKSFTVEELEGIARLCKKYNTYAICDEVYEHMTFDGAKHTPLMTIDGMRDRCIKIGSAGKTFSLTGWKVGYAAAPSHILSPIAKAHQFLVFTTPPNLQNAVAMGLRKDRSYFEGLSMEMQTKRDRLSAGLTEAGFGVVRSASTYFVVADISPLGFDDDVEFCKMLTTEAGVAAVPLSAFYQQQQPEANTTNIAIDNGNPVPKNFVRFCCCKQDHVLDEAIKRLSDFFHSSKMKSYTNK